MSTFTLYLIPSGLELELCHHRDKQCGSLEHFNMLSYTWYIDIVIAPYPIWTSNGYLSETQCQTMAQPASASFSKPITLGTNGEPVFT